MTNTYYQPSLFSNWENDNKNTSQKYQIKSVWDPTFAMTFEVKENEDPEITALENLGYFVLPEQNSID